MVAKKILKAFIGHLPMILLLAVILGGIWMIVNSQGKGQEAAEIIQPYGYTGDGKDITIENDEPKIVMDGSSTQFRVEVKDSGKVW